MRPLRLAFAIPVGLLALLVAAPAWACDKAILASSSSVASLSTLRLAAPVTSASCR